MVTYILKNQFGNQWCEAEMEMGWALPFKGFWTLGGSGAGACLEEKADGSDFFPYSSFLEAMGANCFLSLKSSPYCQKWSSCKIAKKIRLTRKFTECFTEQEVRQYSPTKATSKRASRTQSISSLSPSGRGRGKSRRLHLFHLQLWDSNLPRGILASPRPPSSPCSSGKRPGSRYKRWGRPGPSSCTSVKLAALPGVALGSRWSWASAAAGAATWPRAAPIRSGTAPRPRLALKRVAPL